MTVSANVPSAALDRQFGFNYVMDPATARRQLRLSLLVLATLVLAIATAALNLCAFPSAHPGETASLKVQVMPLRITAGSQG